MSKFTSIESGPANSLALIPYLAVQDARQAIAWYGEVFGAQVDGDPIVMPDGRIGHSELRVGDAVFYLSDAHPDLGVVAPSPGTVSVSFVLAVADTDAVLARLEAGGGHRDREPEDARGERNAWVIDPFGHRWLLHSPLRP